MSVSVAHSLVDHAAYVEDADQICINSLVLVFSMLARLLECTHTGRQFGIKTISCRKVDSGGCCRLGSKTTQLVRRS